MKQPRISLVMVINNHMEAKFFSRSLAALRQQDYQNWELLVCVRQTGLLATLKEKEVRVFDVSGYKKLGQIMNYALAQSQGLYWAQINVYERLCSCWLLEQVTFLEENPRYGFVSGRGQASVWQGQPGRYHFLRGNPFVSRTLLFRKSLLGVIKGYDESYDHPYLVDYDLCMRLYAYGSRGYILPTQMLQKESPIKAVCPREEAGLRMRGYSKLGMRVLGFPFALTTLIKK